MNTDLKSGTLRSTVYRIRYILFFAVVFSLLYNLLRLTGPLFIILIYDRVLPSRSEATLAALFLLVVIFLIVMLMLDYSRRRILARFGAQFQESVEDCIFSATKRDAYLSKNTSKPMGGLDELDRLRSFFHSDSLVAILDFLWCPMFLFAIFIIHASVGWVVVGGLVLLLLIVVVKTTFAKDRNDRFNEASQKIGSLKDMLIASRDTIQAQGMTAAYNQRFVQARRMSRDRAIELNDWNAWFSTLSKHTAMLMQYSVLATGAYLTLSDQLTIGAMVACMFLSMRVFYPVEHFVKQLPTIGEAIADWKSLDKTLKVFRSTPTHSDMGAAPTLSLSGLQVRSPLTKQKLLRAVDLEIESGSTAEIVGESGSGKTVLAETILGRIPRSAGRILFGGIDVEQLSVGHLGETFGYVPQHVAFVNGTIEENIACLHLCPDRERLVAVARMAQVHDVIRALPDGYGTLMDAAASSFSKSERHQIALARALYADPKVLIVDEPDQTFREALSRNLKGAVAGLVDRGGILIVLSRLSLKTFQPTRRFYLEGGLLKESRTVRKDFVKSASNVVNLTGQKLVESKAGKAVDEN